MKDYADLKTKRTAAHIEPVFDNDKNKQIMVNFPDNVRMEFNEDASFSVPANTTRRNLPAAKIPGGEVDFLKAKDAPAPTKGRTLDHIGFEVQDLEAFTKKLEAGGMKFDMPFRDVPAIGLKIAFIVDPVGTRIELTQGLAGR